MTARMTLLDETLAAITGLDTRALAEARERNDRLTKPRGALGALEPAGIQLAGIAGECPPPIPAPAAVAVFAADHGVHAEGVSPWPQEVTAQMVFNFLDGGAAINVFAGQVGADLLVVDVGVATPLEPGLGLAQMAVRSGTGNIAVEPAMTRDEARRAVEVGITIGYRLVDAGARCLLSGDMGIANTTASAALIAAFSGRDAVEVTGRGTGVDEATYQHKVDVVRRALARHAPDPAYPLGVLAAVGGLEHAAIAGLILAGAARRVPVLLDGVIAGAAALVARGLSPLSIHYCFAGHRSTEPGHAVALELLGLSPFIDLGLRLGEGTGAVLALPLLQCAARALREMATFDSAGVSEKAV
jgi:nicotinate-nucleotide--dimethylbenzimidazole phosphoribosyltransferase